MNNGDSGESCRKAANLMLCWGGGKGYFMYVQKTILVEIFSQILVFL